jgi:riboflavin kinase/FMN adenylyltransferase
MKLVRYLRQDYLSKPSVVCMGNFDGMHLGHQMMIESTVQLAKKMDCISVIIVFEPHPKEFFLQDKAPARLMRLSEKIDYLRQMGVDQVICLKFNDSLSSMSPQAFVQNVLMHSLQMKAMVISVGARFGHKQVGDVSLLESLSVSLGFHLVVLEKKLFEDQRICSTTIRELLAKGHCEKASVLLGKPYAISGRIIHGNQLGRTLGFPTINIACQRSRVALSGIFAVHVKIEHCISLFTGVAHIAKRSIVNDQKPLLEVNLFDFNQEVYGKRASVSFLHKIRDTQSVSDLSQLKQMISKDVHDTKAYFLTQSKSFQ